MIMLVRSKNPFTPGAVRRWAKIPEWAQKKILDHVFCPHCCKSVTILLETAKMQRKDLVLRGKCKICGGIVCRVVEPENE